MTEDSEKLARRFFQEIWNERRIETIAELAHPDGVAHHSNGRLTNAEQFHDLVFNRFVDAFPDLTIDVEDIVADGDRAVVRWRARGMHLGDGLGVKASHQPVSFVGTTWFVFRNGKLIEAWDCWDHGGLLQTLWRAAPPDSGILRAP